MRVHRSLVLLASLALSACGASVTSAPTGGDGGADVPVASDVPVSQDVPVTPDVPMSCGFAGAESVAIAFTGPDNARWDCAAPRGTPGQTPTVVTRSAAVLAVTDDATGSTLRLDFCSPAADCTPRVGTLRVSAPGFSFAGGTRPIQRGQLVQIRARASWTWGCTMQVEVSNAPMWDGMQNPVRADSALLAAAANGEGNTLPNAPFELTRQAIGCRMSGTDCGGGPPELFALVAQGHCNNCLRDPDPVTIRQGRAELVEVNELRYLVRNHRSFNTGFCDDYWNYAWSAREATPRQGP